MYKNNSGKWITKGLFYELTLPDNREYCLFTLKEENHIVDGTEYLSLKQAFLACAYDPTEYTFANKYLGGWSHWKELQKTADIKAHVADWREERDILLRSDGVKKMVELAKGEEPSYQAVKWLADKGWEEAKEKGRPSKQDVRRAAREQATTSSRLKQDRERILGRK